MSCNAEHCAGHSHRITKYPLNMYRTMFLNRWRYFTLPSIKHNIKIYRTLLETRLQWLTKR